MPLVNISPERLDTLAHEALGYVFKSMAEEGATFSKDAWLVGLEEAGADLFPDVEAFKKGYFTIVVGYIGDAKGLVWLSITRELARELTMKILDTAYIDWEAEESAETLNDAMGELGNSFVGLIKGGLTKNFPNLMLTTPKVIAGARLNIDASLLSFRKQYLFTVMGEPVLVDFCHE